MLDAEIFTKGINLLQLNYDRQLPEQIQALWLEHLTNHLTNEEFLVAVKYMILHKPYMPVANDLVEHIHGTKEAQALIEWQYIIKAASGRHEELAYLSVRAQIALQAIGGIYAVGGADEFATRNLQKSFTTIYCQCPDKDSRMLAQNPTTAPQKPQQGAPEPAPMPEHLKEKMEALKRKVSMN